MHRRRIIFIVSCHVHFFTTHFNVFGSLDFQISILCLGMIIRLLLQSISAFPIVFTFPSTRRCDANGEFQPWLLALISICERIVFAPSKPANHGVLFWQAGRLQSSDKCEPLLEGGRTEKGAE